MAAAPRPMTSAGFHVCAPLLPLAQRHADSPVWLEAARSAAATDSPSSTRAGPSTEADTTQQLPTAQPSPLAATGAQLLRRIALLSRALSMCVGLVPGDVVVLVAQTSAASMEVMLAALDAGCIVAPLNWRWSAMEVAEASSRLSPSLILYDEPCGALAAAATASASAHAASSTGSGGPAASQVAAASSRTCLIQPWTAQGLQAEGGLRVDCSPVPNLPAWSTGLLLQLADQALASAAHHPPAHGSGPFPCPSHVAELPAWQRRPVQAPGLQLLSPRCGTAVLVFTSGTTSSPKAVRLTHDAWHVQARALLLLCTRSCRVRPCLPATRSTAVAQSHDRLTQSYRPCSLPATQSRSYVQF
jgi:acyl-CoA synthetase (AMP-forming)/AMP-acid ligase II